MDSDGGSVHEASPPLSDAAFRADPKAPFTTTQFAYEIEGVHTEFVLSSFSNLLFFTVTQLGKLGSLMLARRDETLEGEESYTVTSLLGKKDNETEIYARRLVEVTSAKSSKPLLLAIGLRPEHQRDPKVFRAICKIIAERTQ